MCIRDRIDGHVQIKDTPDSAIPLAQLAQKANPMRGAVQPGTEPGLESTDYFGPRYGATASGVHAMIIEIDPETMSLAILRYACLLYTSPSPRDRTRSRMPSSA